MSLELILSEPELIDIKTKVVQSTLEIDDDLRKEINKSWGFLLKEMKSKGIKVWNGKKYRFESISYHSINLSETDFKTNICLRRIGQMQARSNAVVVSNIITSDNYLVFGKRKNVGVNPDLIAWIAGGVEPIQDSENLLIDTMKIELKEELGLNVSEYALLLKLVYKSVEQGAYYFYFETRTKLTKELIIERFKNADENEENSELIFYQNTKEGIAKLTHEKDMLLEVVEFFNKFYEIKH